MDYISFFKRAFDEPRTPYPYQVRIAENGKGGGRPCTSQLISVETGLGKTAAVVLAWLWNRVVAQRTDWPRRLVYCLPMRTLVEQTEQDVRRWLENLSRNTNGMTPQSKADLEWLHASSPVVLMGGEELDAARRKWDLYPEMPAIIIGTQDMLLSRALNRGYGMSRFRWPMHFALLNNDCLWVLDETQLMGVGVETSAQLDGFRHMAPMPTVGPCPTWWMSATLSEDRLSTVDHRPPEHGWPVVRLSAEERAQGRPAELLNAGKPVVRAPIMLTRSGAKEYPAALARYIKEAHAPGTLTLVVVNRVSRAQEVYRALTTAKKGQTPLYDPARVGLVHSRFRGPDRERMERLMHDKGDRIIIATQAVEAGVDISARVLITELAPWASLVQRFGRCNRRADHPDAEIHWIDIGSTGDKSDPHPPYTADELDQAREALARLDDAAPARLSCITIPEPTVVRPVLRRRELVELFDTTPDISGHDIDLSRYIRDGEDTDVQLYWRVVEGDTPSLKEPVPGRDELCRVTIGAFKKFLNDVQRKKKGRSNKPPIWRWDHLDRCWRAIDRAVPGATYLVDVEAGGYSGTLGWTGSPNDQPEPLVVGHAPPQEANDDDLGTFAREWETLPEHTAKVVETAKTILHALGAPASPDDPLGCVIEAAGWHDVGKLHPAFRSLMTEDGEERPGGPWAKSPHDTRQTARPGFRHELASAIAWLLAAPHDVRERDLVAYLIAAHHGKVRISIRALPNEKTPPDDRLYARGVWSGDELPAITLGPHRIPQVRLDLSFLRMGEGPHGPSWLARTIALRDRFGPFTLAYLETLLRAADARASNTH